MATVYTGTGPVRQKGNAMRQNDFKHNYYKAGLPDMLMRRRKVFMGDRIRGTLASLTKTTHMLPGRGPLQESKLGAHTQTHMHTKSLGRLFPPQHITCRYFRSFVENKVVASQSVNAHLFIMQPEKAKSHLISTIQPSFLTPTSCLSSVASHAQPCVCAIDRLTLMTVASSGDPAPHNQSLSQIGFLWQPF